jgi:hypothetical protein
MITEQIAKLADEFDAELRAELSESDYDDAVVLNRDEESAGVCHTHDFCDANVFMAEAFEKVVGRPIDLQSDADTALWNAAWSEWKSRDVVTDEERSNGPSR